MDMEMQKLRSDKDVHEWYPLCPCQVRKNTVYETDGRVYLSVTTAILTAGHVTALHVTIEPTDVVTPFPPRKRKKTGQIWPITAKSEATSCPS